MRLPTIFAFLALLQAIPASAGWLRLPTFDRKPVGMELAYAGTTIQSSAGIADAASIIMGDVKKSAKISPGRSEAVLKFARQSFIQKLSFINDGLEGHILLSISSDNGAWIPLGDAALDAATRLVSLDIGRAQGKYVKFSFELSKGGSIRGVQLVGSDSDANYIVMQDDGGSGAPLNFASGIGGGRLVFLSDNAAGAARDAQFTNSFRFSGNGGKVHTAVYDLGQERSLNEVASIHSAVPVQMQVYAFAALPEKENWRGRPAFDASVFETLKPVASSDGRNSSGIVTLKPANNIKARYVALRWTAEPNANGFEVYGVSLTGMASIFFQNVDLTATTFRDGEGHIVTRLSSAPAGESDAELVKYANEARKAFGHATSGMDWNNGATGNFGLLFGSYYKGGGSSYGSVRRKDEDETPEEGEEDPDADPPAVHIIWCPEASP